MEKDFWHKAWEEGRTRFHKEQPNKLLVKFLDVFKDSKKVFVPLCGKSLDLLYLRDQGLKVVGVELSELAIEGFFKDNKLGYKKRLAKKHEVYETEGIQIYHGDLFELEEDVLGDCDALYDRASLIALPPKMRQRYADFLIETATKIQTILLLSFEYTQEKADGPPFSVSDREIKQLYQRQFEIQEILRESTDDLNPRFEGKGIEDFVHTAHQLTRL